MNTPSTLLIRDLSNSVRWKLRTHYGLSQHQIAMLARAGRMSTQVPTIGAACRCTTSRTGGRSIVLLMVSRTLDGAEPARGLDLVQLHITLHADLGGLQLFVFWNSAIFRALA